MTRAAQLAVLSCLALAPLAAVAQEQTWDPSRDEGVPEKQLFEGADQGKAVPGARVGRRPVQAAPEPAAVDGEEAAPVRAAPETVEVVKPRRKAPGERRQTEVQIDGEELAPEGAPETLRQRPKKASKEKQFGSRRIQVFLIPVGQAASLAAGPAQLALEAEVARLPGFKPVDLVEELAVPPSGPDAQKMAEARRIVGDGNKQMVAHQYDESANRFRRAVKLMESANDALESAEYADANARLGVALLRSGEEDAAKAAFQLAARADLANMVDGRSVDRTSGAGLDTAREEVAASGVGALSVVTSPPGARVFVGGLYRGTSPLTIDRVPVGINYLRVDRPGAFPVVRFVDVKEANDTPARIKMKFTPEALELQKTLIQVPRALSRTAGVPDMVKALGTRFRLERSVIATVEMTRTNIATIRAVVFDFPKDARLIDESAPFAVDVEGGLEAAVGNWARMVFDKADGSVNRAAKDPLDRGDGTEDWYSTSTVRTKTIDAQSEAEDAEKPEWERSNYSPTSARKKGVESKDPLDHSNGTEDW